MSQARNTLLKPLTARSVVASTLLGITPPQLPAAALVASGAQFGVAPGTTRVALSRMVDAGELVVTDDGVYALAGGLLARHARQEQGRHPVTTDWHGDWRMAVVVASGRGAASRARLRMEMGKLRMAELREGVWLRPANLDLAEVEECTWFTARPDDVDTSSLFGLPDWARTAGVLLEELRRTVDALSQRDASALGETFVIAAATTRHLTLDPLLPDELLPGDWPGAELRRVYDRYQQDFAATWRDWFRSVSST